MLTVYFEASRRLRKRVKKNQPLSIRRASEILKELEEEAQAAGSSEAVVYVIYDGNRLLFKDRHLIGVGQPTNLLFLVQEALTTVFVDEPEADKDRLLQRVAEAMRAPEEPEPADVPPCVPSGRFFSRLAFWRKPKGDDRRREVRTHASRVRLPKDRHRPKAPNERTTHTASDVNRNEKQEPAAAVSQEPNQERGEPVHVPAKGRRAFERLVGRLKTCRTIWQKYGPVVKQAVKQVAKSTATGMKIMVQHHQAAQLRREERRIKALDVQLEQAKQKAKLYEELAADRERVRKQVEEDARHEERLARELKEARTAKVRSGHGRTWIGGLVLVAFFLSGLWYWQHPDQAHQAMETIVHLKNQVLSQFGMH
ncbi:MULTISPECIES: hypothetical protein [unclassified Sporolactobacillus]|uniref:hypothetical protein n=1 Tax=unclassified Sporolactobacillus TaxID=2628533 RepID=UPI00236745C3|nr:hypothetical protein [Sporolactobacillus sp. CQH2019]MDD9150444.1 hypothetical protein [Sporolactobacillus sp. CQH2019]